MPCTVQVLWNDRFVGLLYSNWDSCGVRSFARDEELAAFGKVPGRFLAADGVEASPDWYRGLRVDGQFVDGLELELGDIEPLEDA